MGDSLYFRILGPLAAERDGQSLAFGAPRQRQVLALLLASANRLVSTDRLVGDLWPAGQPETARHTVQAYVHRLRKALGAEADRLVTGSDGYRLRVSEAELDALRFEKLVSQAGLAKTDPTRRSHLLSTALDLWRGPVFADIPEMPSLLPEIARLETMRTAALEERFEADLARGRHSDLVAEIEAVVATHPLRERLWGQLMLALYRSERQSDALRAFQRAKTTLGEELGISPGPGLVELEGRILLQDPALSATEGSQMPEPVENLPVSRTSFIGRHEDLAVVGSMMQRARLVTVTGPPGVGKTRLAIEVARAATDDFPHGVCFVPLSDLDDPTLLASTMAGALGVMAPDRDLRHALIEHLKPRRMLLVLDNLEHVLDGADLIGRLIDTAAGLVVLATSRLPTRLSGENVYRLDPLPPLDADVSVPDSGVNPAIQLFADRARAFDPGFAVTTETAADICQIVDSVDRLPLGIELAAARLGVLSLPELTARIERALPLLNKGRLDGQRQHRTLTDAIAWSYDQLSPSQKSTFRRLSVFRGRFTIAQAEVIAAGPPVQDVVEDLLDLVEANLIVGPVTTSDDGFSILKTVREYADGSLKDSGEAGSTLQRLADYYATLAEGAESELVGPNQGVWLDRLSAEYPNILAALAWARDHQADTGLAIAGGLWRFWQFRGMLSDGRKWLEELLGASDDTGVLRVKGLLGLAGICYWQTDYATAEATYSEALELVERIDDPLLRAEALFGQMQTLACAQGNVETASPLQQELHALAAAADDPALTLMDIGAAGAVRFYTQDWEGARPYMTQTLEMARAAGNRWMEREILFGLASSSYFQGRYEEASNHLTDALAIALEMGHPQGIASALYWLGMAAILEEDAEHGVMLVGASARVREEHGGGFVAEDVGLADIPDPMTLAREVLHQEDIDRQWAKGWATPEQDLLTLVDTTS